MTWGSYLSLGAHKEYEAFQERKNWPDVMKFGLPDRDPISDWKLTDVELKAVPHSSYLWNFCPHGLVRAGNICIIHILFRGLWRHFNFGGFFLMCRQAQKQYKFGFFFFFSLLVLFLPLTFWGFHCSALKWCKQVTVGWHRFLGTNPDIALATMVYSIVWRFILAISENFSNFSISLGRLFHHVTDFSNKNFFLMCPV